MSFLHTFEGSLGLRLISPINKENEQMQLELEAPLLIQSISEFINLIKITKDIDSLKNRLNQLKSRSASSYQKFLEQFVSIEGQSIYLDWGSNYPNYGGNAELSQDDAVSAISAISETVKDSEEEITTKAKVIGININSKKKSFEIEDVRSKEIYQGKISNDAVKQIEGNDISFNSQINLITLKETINIKQSTGEGIASYTLLSINDDSGHPIRATEEEITKK